MKAGIVVLGVGAAIAAAMFSGGDANAAPPVEPPKPDPDPSKPPPVAPPADDFLPGTKTPKSSVRAIDKSTTTPSAFALKYSGDAGRWKEIVDANPTGTVYPGSPAIELHTWYQLDTDADGNTLASGQYVTGLAPWMLNALVRLPSSWKG